MWYNSQKYVPSKNTKISLIIFRHKLPNNMMHNWKQLTHKKNSSLITF